MQFVDPKLVWEFLLEQPNHQLCVYGQRDDENSEFLPLIRRYIAESQKEVQILYFDCQFDDDRQNLDEYLHTQSTDKLCTHTPSVVHLIDNAGFLRQYPQKHLDLRVLEGLWWTVRTQANNPRVSFDAQCS